MRQQAWAVADNQLPEEKDNQKDGGYKLPAPGNGEDFGNWDRDAMIQYLSNTRRRFGGEFVCRGGRGCGCRGQKLNPGPGDGRSYNRETVLQMFRAGLQWMATPSSMVNSSRRSSDTPSLCGQRR